MKSHISSSESSRDVDAEDLTIDDTHIQNLVDTQNPSGSGKRVKRSTIWAEFTEKVMPDGSRKACCIYCHKLLVSNSQVGTRHLWRHIDLCAMKKLKSTNQADTSLHSTGTTGTRVFKFDPEVTRREIACMIIEDEEPFSKVESRRFRRVLASLNPDFQMVSRNTIRNDCESIYLRMKDELKRTLSLTCDRIALTTDMWTSNQTLSYMAVTTHFIDRDWKLQKRIIRFAQVETPHTGIILAQTLMKALVDWDIDRKVVSITLDNASANDRMCNKVRTSLADMGALPANGALFHMRCCAHILHLVVHKGLGRMQQSVVKIHDSVKYVTITPSRKQKFDEVVTQIGLITRKGLCADVSTRWNSTYLMLESALLFKKAFIALETWDANFAPPNFTPPSIEDWIEAEKFLKFLKIFYTTTVSFSGSMYPTINLCLQEILAIHLLLKKEIRSSDMFMSDMARVMQNKFNKYWGEKTKIISTADSRLLIALGAILDPRQKLMFVHYAFNEFYGDESMGYANEVKKALHDIFQEYQTKYGATSSENQDIAGSDDNYEDGSPNLMRKFQKFIKDNASNQQNHSELDQYLGDTMISYNQIFFDILDW